ncbi:MAG: putative phosphinothricin acetyltransferase YwnH [Chloroflexi bacterium ADurb.Bin180]|nr:MAG: putative phosphinothricin acetyltransferase YwnH [Chloroflexi bacterium ADurb.Bin180]
MADRVVPTRQGDVLIRAAREGDVEAYRELRLEALQNHPDAFGSDYATAAANPPEYWTERLKNAGSTAPAMFIARAEGQPVGLCGLARENRPKSRHSAELISLYVRSAWRGLGVGEALVKAALDWGSKHGVRIVKLAVVTQNCFAIRLYERCGFTPYGTEPEVIYLNGRLYDMILMYRRIDASASGAAVPETTGGEAAMLIRRSSDVAPVRYGNGVEKRVLLGPNQGAPHFVMRTIDVPPGQSSPWHKHEWEHEMFVLAGSGVAVREDGETAISVGDAILVPGNEMHSVKNTGTELLRFICMVPLSGEDNP